MFNYLLAEVQKTQNIIPQPLQDVVNKVAIWLLIAAIVLPILVLLIAWCRLKVEKKVDEAIAEDKKNKRKYYSRRKKQ